ncbi:MAG: hypothetical protein IPP57_18400 [Candidatus Obscuribacter sp.]|nr:hypothetical protein [Candidatus Obscuribacter sp.]MBL0188884.1 hypothetical protein [Candidatus Obscuribacter sp.]MBP6351346.1 hypothetical protein [Candidatus Obscuribacter sp.]MBP6594867.1 hypothetical protein [Candidatus Obscuribacter sp.]MBP7578195.1 hypothetical protein [Candidatus Obscuribacter sp.]
MFKTKGPLANLLVVIALVFCACFSCACPPLKAASGAAWVEQISDSKNPQALKILFVGHSKMYWHDLPKVFAYLMSYRNPNRLLKITEVNGSSYALDDHWRDGQALDQLRNNGPWDYVVLFEKTGRPESSDSQLFEKYVSMFDAEARKVHARTVLVENYNADDDRSDDASTHQAMLRVASAKQCCLVPIGTAWSDLRLHYPRINLYDADKYHPSLAGTYLMACVLYCYFSQTAADNLPLTLDYEDARDHTNSLTANSDDGRQIHTAAWSAVRQLLRR